MDNFKILLVDDEVDFLTTLEKRLKKRELNVFIAKSGEEALAITQTENIDIVVLDVRMPGLDGIETLKEIKKIDPAIEVILLTGHANIEVAVEGLELGAFDYLMKPIDIDELLYKLQDAFQKKSIRKKL